MLRLALSDKMEFGASVMGEDGMTLRTRRRTYLIMMGTCAI
jgi:hypothetical protein